MVSIEAVSKTDLMRISIKSGVPGKAKEIVDTWVTLFIEENKHLGGYSGETCHLFWGKFTTN